MLSQFSFAPTLPLSVYYAIAAIVLLIAVYGLIRAPRGGIFRTIAALCLLGLIGKPALRSEEKTPLPDIAIILTDDSASQQLDQRNMVTKTAAETLTKRLEALGNIEIRQTEVTGFDETKLGEALALSLADVPRSQLGAIFILSDGQVIDPPASAAALGINAPTHLLLSGRTNEIDRRVEIITAPRFGIVNEPVEITFKINDVGTNNTGPVAVTLRLNGEDVARQAFPVGEEVTINAALDTPGETIIEIKAATIEGELTTRNNHAVIQISAIRDRLRVLLVSGEPHAGERVWRNILKSDPAVDLVHFTILKPYEKQSVAPSRDLNLIAFPHDQLFLEKLPEFDVLIFDRYTYRSVLSRTHFDRIAKYVENGGALLIASGPEFNDPKTSLAAQRTLAYILPATPMGRTNEEPFIPLINDQGARHPVTRDLQGRDDWGRWLRTIPSRQRSGTSLMDGAGGAPLLIVDRVEQGRVALLQSDHVWLWARGFDGGGPHRELLRRLVHWLMKEPELEEEALELTGRSNGAGGTLTLTRRTMGDEIEAVELFSPDEKQASLTLKEQADGVWELPLEVDLPGLYRAQTTTTDGRTLYAVTALGLAAPPEFDDVVQTAEKLAPLINGTGGGVYGLRQQDRISVPSIRAIKPSAAATGSSSDKGWAGFVRQKASRIEAVSAKPLAPPILWLVLIGASLLAAWLVEGRGLPKFKAPKPGK